MVELRRRKIDTTVEKRIITGMIVSKKFLRELGPMIQDAFFQNEYAGTVASWCLEFYGAYEDAPFEHITDIFNNKRRELKEEDAEIVEKLLGDISQRYDYSKGLNVDYLLDQSIKYFTRRDLETRMAEAQYLLERNFIEEAQKVIEERKILGRLTSKAVDPFDQSSVDEVFEEMEDFLVLPGQLGRFLHNFDRDWLVGIVGPFKRGKTWMLQEFALAALLSRLRVVFFSLEMSYKQMNKRIYQRLTGTKQKEGGKTLVPCFDCLKNQDNSCKLKQRMSPIGIRSRSGNKPLNFDPKSPYKSCTACRGTSDFICDFWFNEIDVQDFSQYYINKQIKAYRKKFKHTLKVISYPRFGANTDDIKRDLDELEAKEEFVPDVIIIDYADILRPEQGASATGIEAIDLTWKCLGNLAMTRHCLTVTGTQATRDALEAMQVRQKHTSLWIGKLAHVDAMLSLNQTEQEKEQGIMRVGTMAHRHEEFHEMASCYVLQNLKMGQVLLDSEINRGKDGDTDGYQGVHI